MINASAEIQNNHSATLVKPQELVRTLSFEYNHLRKRDRKPFWKLLADTRLVDPLTIEQTYPYLHRPEPDEIEAWIRTNPNGHVRFLKRLATLSQAQKSTI